jgi:DNA gyrase subunit A
MRLVVELKAGAQPHKVLNQLYKYTQLQSTYSIQMLALVQGEPRNLSLKRALQIYIQHRYDVIVRRAEFELEKRRARAHILEGLLKALSSVDAIIQTIRSADDADEARQNLMSRFDLTEPQANAILEMQLRRLAALEQQKLQDEFNEIQARIGYLDTLLASPDMIRAVIREDITDLSNTYGDERRTDVLHGVSTNFNEADLVREEEVVVLLTQQGYIKRVPSSAYRSQRRGGKGVIGMMRKEEDGLKQIVSCNSLDTLLFFTDKGKVYSQRAFSVMEAARNAKGILAHSFLALMGNERITAIVPVSSFEGTGYFVMATRLGRIKRVRMEDFDDVRPSGLIAINLEPGDTLNWAKLTDGTQDVILVTEQGQSIRFHETTVRVMGRQATGVNAIRLIADDVVAGMDVVRPDATQMLIVTRYGYGKRTPVDAYSPQGRYGLGVRTLARNERTGPIVAMRCINPKDDILLITREGVVLRTHLEQIREIGRNTQGVILMNLADGDELAGIAVIEGESEDVIEPVANGDDESMNGTDAIVS